MVNKPWLDRAQEILREVERLQWSSQWPDSGRRIRHLIQEYRELQRQPWTSEDGDRRGIQQHIWASLVRASRRFSARRAQARERASISVAVIRSKEQLVLQAEQMTESSDWATIAARYRECFKEWRDLGGPVNEPTDLWQRMLRARSRFRLRQGRASRRRLMKTIAMAERLTIAEAHEPVPEAVRLARQILAEISKGSPVLPVDRAASERLREHCLAIQNDYAERRTVSRWISLAQVGAYEHEANMRGDTAAAQRARAEAKRLRARISQPTASRRLTQRR